ncbi:bacteriophage antitermination protein Q [Enterobacter hormaechei]|uniref:bacteriophage antitermination protein Q n=1 Tax=Enterobacter hormaechei TaxID=158836 RepID=UPI003CC6C569
MSAKTMKGKQAILRYLETHRTFTAKDVATECGMTINCITKNAIDLERARKIIRVSKVWRTVTYQVAITQWAWDEFREQLGTKKVAGKTLERLKKLIWLAAQDVKAELAGRETYEYQSLASLVGVTPKNWSETFTDRWVDMRRIFLRLDIYGWVRLTQLHVMKNAKLIS